MVEMRGFEPLTPWMQTRCSAGLSYIPVGRHVTNPQRGWSRSLFDTVLSRLGPVAQPG